MSSLLYNDNKSCAQWTFLRYMLLPVYIGNRGWCLPTFLLNNLSMMTTPVLEYSYFIYIVKGLSIDVDISLFLFHFIILLLVDFFQFKSLVSTIYKNKKKVFIRHLTDQIYFLCNLAHLTNVIHWAFPYLTHSKVACILSPSFGYVQSRKIYGRCLL